MDLSCRINKQIYVWGKFKMRHSMCAAHRAETGMPVIFLVLRPSPTRRFALLLGHVFALLAVGLADLPWLVSLPLAGLLLVSAWIVWHQAPAARAVQWGRDGCWQLQRPGGEWIDAALNLAASRSWLGWVFLSFRLENGRYQGVVLFADSVDKDALRCVRARLKLEAASMSAS